jgi:hypothetical protein
VGYETSRLGPLRATSKFIVAALRILYPNSTIFHVVFHIQFLHSRPTKKKKSNFYRVGLRRKKHCDKVTNACSCACNNDQHHTPTQEQPPYTNQQINSELKTSVDNDKESDAEDDIESDRQQQESLKVSRKTRVPTINQKLHVQEQSLDDDAIQCV